MLSLVPDPTGVRTMPGLGVSGVSLQDSAVCTQTLRWDWVMTMGSAPQLWAGEPSLGAEGSVAPKGANQRTCLSLKLPLLHGVLQPHHSWPTE